MHALLLCILPVQILLENYQLLPYANHPMLLYLYAAVSSSQRTLLSDVADTFIHTEIPDHHVLNVVTVTSMGIAESWYCPLYELV